jgi:hypothetical protein
MSSLDSVPLVLMLFIGATAPLRGQAREPQVGDRVRLRLTTSPRPIEGTVFRLGGDTLVLAPRGARALGDPLVLPLDRVQQMDLWRGRRSQWRLGAEIGSFAGFVTASAIFASRMSRCVGLECGKSAEWLPYAAAGSLAGAAIGCVVGLSVRHDMWQRVAFVQVRPQVAMVGNRLGVGFSLTRPVEHPVTGSIAHP